MKGENPFGFGEFLHGCKRDSDCVFRRAVQRGRGFEQAAGLEVIGNFVVAHGGVVAQAVADAGIDEAVRLERVHHVGQLAALRGGDGHGRVEPDQAQVAVVGQQLAHLGLDLFLEALRVVLGRRVGEIPVVRPAHHLPVVRAVVVRRR